MKPIKEATATNVGNMTGETVAFGIDNSSLAHIYDILSDLYSDRELAVLRELAANGLDAQVESGYTGPVEIALPTRINPVLTITDHGVGMSVDDLHKIYTKYGASTKRESDDQIGMLGLGSKSPLALADSFTVTTVKGGIKTVAMVTKEDGIGQLRIIDTSVTNEDSGTTIAVATAPGNFASKAETLFRFWKPGTVVVCGSEPDHAELDQIGPNMFVSYSDLGGDYIVMGGIGYKIAHNGTGDGYARGIQEYRYQYSISVVVMADMGDVHFTPSREGLKYTPRTIKFVEDARKQFEINVAKHVADGVETLDTAAEVVSFIDTWKRAVPGLTLPTQWRGIDIPTEVKLDNGWNIQRWNNRNTCNTRFSVGAKQAFKTTFFTGVPGRPTTKVRRDVVAYCNENNISLDNVILCLDLDNAGWFDDVAKVDVASLKAAPAVRKARASTAKARHDWVQYVGYEVTKPIEDDAPVYVVKKSFGDGMESAAHQILGKPIVIISRRSENRLLREYPGAVNVVKALRDVAADIEWTDIDRLPGSQFHWGFGDVDPADIDDPVLAHFVEHGWIGKTPNRKLANQISRLGIRVELAEPTDPLGPYPLLSPDTRREMVHSETARKHAVQYANLVYNSLDQQD